MEILVCSILTYIVVTTFITYRKNKNPQNIKAAQIMNKYISSEDNADKHRIFLEELSNFRNMGGTTKNLMHALTMIKNSAPSEDYEFLREFVRNLYIRGV